MRSDEKRSAVRFSARQGVRAHLNESKFSSWCKTVNYFCFNMIGLRVKDSRCQTAPSDSGFPQVNLPMSGLCSQSKLPSTRPRV